MTRLDRAWTIACQRSPCRRSGMSWWLERCVWRLIVSDVGGFGCVIITKEKKNATRAGERIARIVRRQREIRECREKKDTARDASHRRRVGSLGTDKAYPEIRWLATALVESSVVVLRCRRRDRFAAQVTVISRFAHHSAAPTRYLEGIASGQVSSGIAWVRKVREVGFCGK